MAPVRGAASDRLERARRPTADGAVPGHGRGGGVGDRTGPPGELEADDVETRGVSRSVPEILDDRLAAGRWFTDAETEHARPVCVLGSETAATLFPGLDPIGRTVRVLGRRTTVVGVGEARGAILGSSQDDWLALPLATLLDREDERPSLTLYAAVAPGVALDLAREELRSRFRRVRRLAPDEDDDFVLEGASDYRELWRSVSGNAGAVALAVSAVATVVGGLIVMNVLLIDVTRRRREIGIRRSVGARRGEVVLQILLESALLTLGGAVLGLVVGAAVASLVGRFFPVSVFVGRADSGAGAGARARGRPGFRLLPSAARRPDRSGGGAARLIGITARRPSSGSRRSSLPATAGSGRSCGRSGSCAA